MASSDLVGSSQARLIESRHRIATSAALITTALLRITRGRRIAGGSDDAEPAALCSLCEKPVVTKAQDSMKINDRLYHTDCWDRLQVRRSRA